MAFYNDASIITIPSGYKVATLYSQKPTDASGDMAFTRTGDTATRVNSSGIIERCITNLSLQSNSFNVTPTWTIENVNIGTGITDPNGGTTAFSMGGSSSSSNLKRIIQTAFSVANDVKSVSIYAKANTHSFLQIRQGTLCANFNLSTGTFGGVVAGVTATMTNVGGGWYRCQVSSTNASTTLVIQLVDSLAAVQNENSVTTNSVYIWRAQAELGDFATNYIPTTSTAVTTGPVTNLPRLDYFGTSCPDLLLEPTRTNLIIYSQMLDNAAWVKSASSSVSGNVAVSPDGYTNADLVIGGGSSVSTRIHREFSTVSGTTYNFSAFVKQGVDNISTSLKVLQNSDANIAAINIFFTAGVPTITTTGITTNTKIENYGNGWYRISGNYVSPVTQGNARLAYYADVSGTNKSSYLWGAQLEAGAYATSYIPTTSATVTRNQDLFAKASITSLLGQTEGTLFLDFTFDRQFVNADVLSINDASTSNRVSIGVTASNTLTALVTSAGIDQATITRTIAVGTRYKCAIAYKVNDFVLYVNGVQAGTDTSGLVPASLTRFSNDAGTTSTTPFDYPFNQALVFKTRLTNAELATLTTL